MPPICTYISKLRWRMRSLITYIESFNIILLHCLWLHIYSNRPRKFGRSKLGMYVKTWLPSNPQQQLIYSIIHLFIALSNKNSTFPRRHFKKITSILFECATCCYILWMGHWQREWIKKNTVVSRLHNCTTFSWHFNAAGVISRQLNRLCKYCTVWRRW